MHWTLGPDPQISKDKKFFEISSSLSKDTLWGVETPTYSLRPPYFGVTVKYMWQYVTKRPPATLRVHVLEECWENWVVFFQGYAVEVLGGEAGSLIKVDATRPAWVGPGLSEPLFLGQDERSLGVMDCLPR